MSVRVNLLPEATRARDRVARQRGGLAAAGVALVLGLGSLYWWQTGRINEAQMELAAEQERLAVLQADVVALREFEDLEERRALADDMISVALGGEVSLAGILQDIAAVMPSDAQLDQLTIAVGGEGGTTTSEEPSVGSFTAVGRSLRNHAPGVERFLLELDKIGAFHDLFVSNSRLEDPEEVFATFTVESQLGTEVETGRYTDGVPEELR
jgi:hypothetical protein